MPIEIDAAIQLVLTLIERANMISQLIKTAKAEGQTTLTPVQWLSITDADDAARAALVDALKAKE